MTTNGPHTTHTTTPLRTATTGAATTSHCTPFSTMTHPLTSIASTWTCQNVSTTYHHYVQWSTPMAGNQTMRLAATSPPLDPLTHTCDGGMLTQTKRRVEGDGDD